MACLWFPAICTTKDFSRPDGRSFGLRQLLRPVHPLAGVATRTGAVEFGVPRRLVRLRLFPIVPSLGPDHFGHFGVQEDGAGMYSPGPAQVSARFGPLASDGAIRKYKSIRLVGRRGSGRDVTITQALNVALLKPCCRRAEYEIHVAADVAILKILPAAVQQNGVLPAQKPAVAKRRAVPVHANRQRLPDRAGRILDRDVFRCKIVRVNQRRRGAERADGLAIEIGESGVQIVGDDRRGRIFANEPEEPLLALDVN